MKADLRSVKWNRILTMGWLPSAIAALMFVTPGVTQAHCDGLDGPVVTAAREALKSSNVNRVLIWVSKKDEAEILAAFKQTLAVRKLSPEAKGLADTYFFGTLVRVHRTAEGAPYTGLKPAGRDLGPAIPAADRALETNDVAPLVKLLVDSVEGGVRERFGHAGGARGYGSADVEGGLEYVEQYVTFIHYAERIYEATTIAVHGHFPEHPE